MYRIGGRSVRAVQDYHTTGTSIQARPPALHTDSRKGCEQLSVFAVDSQILTSDDIWIRRLSVLTANSLTRAYTEGCDSRSTVYFRFLIEFLFILLDSCAGILLVGLSYYFCK